VPQEARSNARWAPAVFAIEEWQETPRCGRPIRGRRPLAWET